MPSPPVDPRDASRAPDPPRPRPLWAGAAAASSLSASLAAGPAHVLTLDQAATLARLVEGTYAPLDGFMDAAVAARVAASRSLPDDTYWPLPVVLEVSPTVAGRVAEAGTLVLREAEGRAVAVVSPATAWEGPDGWHIAGRVAGLQPPPAYDLLDLRHGPLEVRAAIAERGWRSAVAVAAGRALHRADVGALARLARDHDAGLVLFAVAAAGVVPDRELYGRMRALRHAAAHLGSARTLVVFDPRPAAEGSTGGPMDAIVAAAFGCRRLVAWDAAAPELAEAAARVGLALDVVPAGPAAPEDDGPAALETWTYPEVAAELARLSPPAWARGVTIFFTGLSGSGKSTIANALRVRLLEDGRRTVTLLDGDLVRTHLSSELGFSREHRSLNVRRIAFVAAEITRHGGLAICAPIAPNAAVRRDARAMVEAVGTFLLVHVSTPIEVCEARDPKGLYQRARAGTLPEFTGVSDPYEAPDDADVAIDTSRTTVADAVDGLMAALEARGLLPPTTLTPPGGVPPAARS
jgi:sulfate adenylyltransferase